MDNDDLVQFFFKLIDESRSKTECLWRSVLYTPSAYRRAAVYWPAWRFATSTLAVADVNGYGSGCQIPTAVSSSSAVQARLNYFVHAHGRGSKGACVPERRNQNKPYAHIVLTSVTL